MGAFNCTGGTGNFNSGIGIVMHLVYLYASCERQAFSLIQTKSLSSDLRLIEYTMCLSVVVCVY